METYGLICIDDINFFVDRMFILLRIHNNVIVPINMSIHEQV